MLCGKLATAGARGSAELAGVVQKALGEGCRRRGFCHAGCRIRVPARVHTGVASDDPQRAPSDSARVPLGDRVTVAGTRAQMNRHGAAFPVRDDRAAAMLIARMERVPFSAWHTKA